MSRLKICVMCAHFAHRAIDKNCSDPVCAREAPQEPVYGRLDLSNAPLAKDARAPGQPCGPNGHMWEARAVTDGHVVTKAPAVIHGR